MRRRVLPATSFWLLAKPLAHRRPLLRPRNHRRLRRAAARSSTFSPQVCFHASRYSSPWPLDAMEVPCVGAEAHEASPNCAPSSWRSPSLLVLPISLTFQSRPQSPSQSLSIFTLSQSLSTFTLEQSLSIFKLSQSLAIPIVWSHFATEGPFSSRCPCLVEAHWHDRMHPSILTCKQTGKNTHSRRLFTAYRCSRGLWDTPFHTFPPPMSSKEENCTSTNSESCSTQENHKESPRKRIC